MVGNRSEILIFMKMFNFNKNTQTGVSLTAKKTVPSQKGKFVSRPIVVKKGYLPPSKEASRCYNEEKKELRSLCGFISNPLERKIAQMEEKLRRNQELLARFWAINNVRTSCSYKEIAVRGPHNESPKVSVMAPKIYKHDWSLSRARRDFVTYWKNVQAEKANARKIVEGMAARRPRYVSERFVQRDFVNLEVNKAILNKDRKNSRRAREVKDFGLMCYYEKPVVELPQVEPEPEVKKAARPTSPKQVKKRWNRVSKEQDRGDLPYPCEVPNTRESRRQCLLDALSKTDCGRALLLGYMAVQLRRKDIGADRIIEGLSSLDALLEPQMDDLGAEGKPQKSEDQASTSVISSAQPVDKGIPSEIVEGFHKVAITREIQQFQTVTDRWIPIERVVWDTNKGPNDLVGRIKLPYSPIKKFSNAQNFQLFYTHRWMKPKVMRLKFVLNSNRFQVGLLIADVKYVGLQTRVDDIQDNVYSGLQRNHCRLMAGSSNNAELVIPYQWVDSAMALKEGIDNVIVTLRPLNKLTVTGNVAPQCSITVFLTFDDVELNGMVSREVPDLEPQMDSIANVMNAGSNLISTIRGDNNRDNPPNPINPVAFTPHGMGSLAYMDYCAEPVFSLRADPRGQTPHPTKNDEMSLGTLQNTWSFLQTFTWSTSMEKKDLWTTPVAPLLELSKYPTAPKGSVPTSLAMLASLYGRWRGDIEYKFEVVMNSFYSGSFMVSCIPLTALDDQRDLTAASYSSYVVFDLSDTGERVFAAPWNWRNAFAETRKHEDSYDVPSILKVYWVNPLIAIDNVPPSIYINVYVRGGANFEVSIPRPSILAPRFHDALKPAPGQRPVPYNTESQWYLTYSSDCKSKSGKYPLVPYIQNVKNGWVGYTGLRERQLYRLSDKTTKGRQFRCGYDVNDKNKPRRNIRWGCYDVALSTSNAHGMIVSFDKKDIVNYIRALEKGTPVEEARDVIRQTWKSDSAWSEVYNVETRKWETAYDSNDPPVWIWEELPNDRRSLSDGFEVIEPQMDTVTRVDNPTPRTSMGLQIFGERSPDLKSLCRRWNHFGSIKGVVCSEGLPRDCAFSAILRVNPMRHVNPTISSSYDNRWRNGVVSTVGSMYYLYRGGIRYRFVVIGSPPDGTMMYVSHRYDASSPSSQPIWQGDGKVYSKDDMMNTQYATHGQALSVNTIFTVEVPYYSVRERLMTLDEEVGPLSDNGSLVVWIHSKVSQNIHVEVFYSVADDFRFSVFQGAPVCIDVTTLIPEPQMEEAPASIFSGPVIDGEKPECSPVAKATAKRIEEKQKKSIFATVKGAFTKQEEAAECVVETAKDAKETLSSLRALIEKIKGYVENTVESINSKLSAPLKNLKEKVVDHSVSTILGFFKDVGDTVFRFVSHILYSIISPSINTIAWTLCNLYHVLFGFTLTGVDIVTNFVRKVWQRLKSGPPELAQEERVEPQSDTSEVANYASLLFTVITSICALKVTPPTSWEGIDKGLFKLGLNVRNAKFVGEFLADNIKLLKRVYHRVLGYFGVSSSDYMLIAGIEDDRVRNWVVEASMLVAPSSQEQIENRQDWAFKVFEYALVGRALIVALSNEKVTPPKLLQTVQNIQKRLVELESDCIKRKVFSPARYEPMCTWLCGEGGRGKSRLLDSIIMEFAKNNGHSDPGPVCHTITNGQKYFDGLNNQQIVVIDDFLSTSISLNPDILDLFLQFKSCIPLNPAYSRVEDKVNRVSFRDLVISSNRVWFENDPGITNPEAFNRRRDLLLKLEFLDPNMTVDKFKALPIEELEELKHVKISYASSPGDPKSDWVPILHLQGQSYRKTVFDFINQRHRIYHAREEISYRKRCEAMQKVINSCDNTGSFEEALNKYKSALRDSYDGSQKPDFSPEFDKWLKVCKNAATYPQDREPLVENEIAPSPSTSEEAEVVEAQNDTRPVYTGWENGGYPQKPLEGWTLEMAEVGKAVEPGVEREKCEAYEGDLCRHRTFEYADCIWDEKHKLYTTPVITLEKLSQHKSYAVRDGCCMKVIRKDTGKLCLSPITDCLFNDPQTRDIFAKRFVRDSFHAEQLRYVVSQEEYDEEFMKDFPDCVKSAVKDLHFENWCKVQQVGRAQCLRAVQALQEQVRKNHQVVAGVAIPNQSKWKKIPQFLWALLCTAFKMICKLLKWVTEILKIVLGLCCLIGIVRGFSGSHSKDYLDETPAANLHASGDFKTIKARGGVRSRALALLNAHDSGSGVKCDPIEACRPPSNKKGVINKIINNTFFMVGLKQDGDGFYTYKARCVGLYNRTALCLKHYLEHWQSVGCEKVAVVYNEAKGYITYDLKELDFSWTSEGYGTVTFPRSLPRQFAKITHFIPSESFNGNYPAECEIIETFVEENYTHYVTVESLTAPVTVPGNTTQNAWTITQGLKYPWGGKGRCGSVVIAPSMACPLIAVHTAGVGDKKGFGELLFRETFEPSDELVLEFVEPNMHQEPPPYGLDGEYYCVGRLDKDKTPAYSTKTKIIPSEIHEVFPVKTEPAPLTKEDPRLSVPEDIFRIGCSKRCEPLKEFSEKDLHSVASWYRDRMNHYVKPVRSEVGVLSITQAVEGLPIDGYDPIIMSTSEGYPWTLDRPKNAGSKAWMFQREEYPDGRIKITGIYPPLLDVLHLKDTMRSRGVVPATYFTCCLKDARILKEKVSTPGKTRVFEMCPVDLTISQRMYYQDYVAAFIKARSTMNHTIGINPDGPEWSELANSLLAFSPYIITADYSGYGPHVPHTILDKVFHHRMAWYDEREDVSEEEHDRRFVVRSCIKEENMHGLHVVRDAVVRFASGLDSGNPSTVDLNSEVNTHLIGLAFLGLAKEHGVKHCLDMYFFDKYVLLYSNGDDIIAAVKEEIIDWFNNETLISFFAKFGLKMTDALKEGKTRPYCALEEATYLKRGFLRHPTRVGEWLAPLEKASITDTANWVWQSLNDRHASLVNSEMSSRLAYTQGPEYYEKVSRTLKEAWKEKGVLFEYPSWSSLDAHIWEGTPGPKYSF